MDLSNCLCYNVGMNGWYALVAALVAWFIAQTWKTVAGIVTNWKQIEKMNLTTLIWYVTRSGGMPSGHTAAMVALTTYIGMGVGLDSGLFALSFATTLIIMYDATHVRYAVGEQGQALNKLLKKDGEKVLPVVEGHTVAQVAVGALIGVAIGILAGILLKA